jgi:hypothetical protein
MESVSQITQTIRLPLSINLPPYLSDHSVEGKSVLPAVYAMQILAVFARTHLPRQNVLHMADAAFDRFLVLDSKNCIANVLAELKVHRKRCTTAVLLTRTQAKTASIIRTKAHVTLEFIPAMRPVRPYEPQIDEKFMSVPTAIDTQRLYRDLVPFGPAFHNLKDVLLMSKEGAWAKIETPARADASDTPLGSPFVLDAAFHAACAYGQRFAGFTAFPVGIKARHIMIPTQAGKQYLAYIKPVNMNFTQLTFDIWIFDDKALVHEMVLGVDMRDVCNGRMRPPPWIRQ